MPYICTSMQNTIKYLYRIVFFVFILGLWGCKSEFERVRTNGDPAFLLQKANEYFDAKDYLKAQTLYELSITSFRGKQESETIAYRYAYTYYHLEQYTLAAYYFTNFAQTYGGSRFREEAEFMAAYSNYLLSPVFRLDQKATNEAIEMLQEFANQYPNSDKVAQCNELIDQMRGKLERKAYESAKLYFDLKYYQSAIQTFDNVLKDFPETQRAEEIRYMMVRSSYLLAVNSFVDRQQERFEDVTSRANAFLNRYKNNSGYQTEVSQMLADAQKRLKELEDVRYQNTGSRSGS